nr:PilZ domain-containing protein [Desulfobulbaceae bacterium]
MARHVLIVEKSQANRRMLQSRILAIFDDVILSEAADIAQAEIILDNSIIHLVLYGWEPDDELGITFCREQLRTATGDEIPFVFLVSGKEIAVEALEEYGEYNIVRLPCSAEELAAGMDQTCRPSSLRESKRYCISGMTGFIEQRGLSLACKVLNISFGGMLAEFEMNAQFNCIDPVMISVLFGSQDSRVKSVYAILSNITVIDRNSDHTPRLVRMGVKFLNVPEQALEALQAILHRAEEEEECSQE